MKQEKTTIGHDEKPDIEQLKNKLSGLAEKIAIGFNVRLDYSVGSIKKVEKVLSKIHKDYIKTEDEEGIEGIALEFGAYIVKVMEKHFGPVKWQRDDPIAGTETFPLILKDGNRMFPVAWCLKRIINGPEDNICFKLLAWHFVKKYSREGWPGG